MAGTRRAALLVTVLLVVGTMATAWAVTGTQSEVQEGSTSFQVSNLTAPPSVAAGDTVTVNATVSYEPGETNGTPATATATDGETTATEGEATGTATEGEATGTATEGEATGTTTEAGMTETATETDGSGAAQETATETAADGTEVGTEDGTETGTETAANETATETGTPGADDAVTQTVEFRVDGDVVDRQEVTLAPGESTTVTFEFDTTGVLPGVYIHGIYTEDFGEVAALVVTTGPTGTPTPTPTEPNVTTTPSEPNVTETPAAETGTETPTEEAGTETPAEATPTEADTTETDASGAVQETATATATPAEETETTTPAEETETGTPVAETETPGDETATETPAVETETPVAEEQSFDVRNLTAPASVTQGAVVNATAEVFYPIDAAADGNVTQSVDFRVNGDVVARQNVTLAPGESTTVSFELETGEVEPGIYVHSVFTRDFGEVATLTVRPEETMTETPTNETETPTNETETPTNETETETGTETGTEAGTDAGTEAETATEAGTETETA